MVWGLRNVITACTAPAAWGTVFFSSSTNVTHYFTKTCSQPLLHVYTPPSNSPVCSNFSFLLLQLLCPQSLHPAMSNCLGLGGCVSKWRTLEQPPLTTGPLPSSSVTLSAHLVRVFTTIIIIRLTHVNGWESMGKPCSYVQFINSCIFYKSHARDIFRYSFVLWW